MSPIAGLPVWANDLISEQSAAAAQLNITVDEINALESTSRQRALYVKLVRDYLQVKDALSRFKFFLRVRGFEDFQQRLIDGGRKLDLEFDHLATMFSESRNVLFVDTETTGLGENDEPITIAAVLTSVDIKTGRIAREFHSYYAEREPFCEISPGAARVHGLTKRQLSGKKFNLRELIALFGVSDCVVAHNADFDRRMLRITLADEYNWQCSLRSVDWPTDADGKSLDILCQHFSVHRAQPHNAMSDVRALMSLLSQRKPDGSTFLLDLLR